ncbi:ABC transporter ATP-binding protein [Delftia lacustris]|uniref:ABC transporter ATP-binding protein n=1 Tax=Delftia lacustris TaxID=558537 RepID=UPI00285B2B71|nr:ABC transporter ATP-binding protein [Delftia lacustris]MDR6732261.1 multiple sugar transport system ATP-binding protein [Delftia lacustris]
MAFLDLDRIHKRFGAASILQDISIAVQEGEFLVLVGPSGCGKSTLMNIIAGLEPPSGGRLALGGRDITHAAPAERDISMVFQSYALYPNMTVAGNIGFPLEMRKVDKSRRLARVQEVSRLLQIEHLLGRKPRQLSGGQRQRVAIGRALAREPQLYLFDEPLSNLDAQLRVDMRAEIKKLHQRLGATIIYVTHDQIEAMTLATRIAVMKGGVLQQLGTPQQVYNRPANTFVAGFMGSPRMNLLPARVGEGAGEGQGGPFLDIGGQSLPLPQPLATALQGHAGREVIAGIRAEAVGLAPEGVPAAPGQGLAEARVELLEPTGSDTLALLELGGHAFTARLPPDAPLRAGDRARLLIDLSRLVCFDAATQALIA